MVPSQGTRARIKGDDSQQPCSVGSKKDAVELLVISEKGWLGKQYVWCFLVAVGWKAFPSEDGEPDMANASGGASFVAHAHLM